MTINVESGIGCVWGTYNTTVKRKTAYESSPVQVSPKQIYLTSLFVTINTTDETGDFPAAGVQILVIDTPKKVETWEGDTIANLLEGGDTKILAISEYPKELGSTWGYDPPAEEIVQVDCGNGVDVKVIKGRPVNFGLYVAIYDPVSGDIFSREIGELGPNNFISVDARFVYDDKLRDILGIRAPRVR